jgi:DNA-binding protein
MATPDIRCSTKNRIGLYVRTARHFLLGVKDKDNKFVKDPVDVIQISGLGAAVQMAVSVASRMAHREFAAIEKVETAFNSMKSDDGRDRQVPSIKITLRANFDARNRKRKPTENDDDEE